MLLVLALMIVMMLGGLGLLGFGLHAAWADHARQKRFATAAACAAGASAAEMLRTDCVARGTQRVTYVSTMKDTTSIGLDGDSPMLRFDRAPDWILHVRRGDSVTVLTWSGRDEALCGPNRDPVYAQGSPIMAEDNHLAAALLGAMFACYGGAIALGCVRRGFAWGARLHRGFTRVYDLVVAELTILAFAALAAAILVGHGDIASGIVVPLVGIPVASVATALALRARFRRDLLRPAAPRQVGPVPDLE